MEKDQKIFDLIEREHQRQLKGMELIASENFVSEEVMNAMGSCLTNKYAEGLPGKRYYGGCQVVDIVENLAIERLRCRICQCSATLRRTGQRCRTARRTETRRHLYGTEPRPWRASFSW